MSNILENLLMCFHKQNPTISERVKVLDISFDCMGEDLIDVKEIFQVIKDFPQRDNVRITLKSLSDEFYCFDNQSEENITALETFLQSVDPDEEISVCIVINKTAVDNTISIYNFESFSNDILSKDIIKVMKNFNELLRGLEYLVFEMFDSDCLMSTNSMTFKKAGHTPTKINFNRKIKIEACKQVSCFYNISEYEIIPDDFHITSTYPENPFEKIFLRIKTILSLVFIANTTFMEGNNIKLQISGHRNIDFSYDLLDVNLRTNPELYTIYNWIYTDGNSVDKAIIARNIISLHCKYTQFIDTDEKTFASIQSNYAVYQKNNVSQYLELKNNLAKFIIDLTSKTGEIILGLVDRIKNNAILFVTFLITVFLTRLASSGSIAGFFNKEITILSDLILLGSLLFIYIGHKEVQLQVKKLKQGYDGLKSNYILLLDDTDIKEIFNNDIIFNKNLDELKRYKKHLIVAWIALLIITFFVIEYISTSPLILWFFRALWSKLCGVSME